MPTHLGNILRAAEDYSHVVYGMDSVFWWSRLWFLLPDLVRNEVDESLVPMVALLNLTSLILIVAILEMGYFKCEGRDWYTCLMLFVGLILIALLSYRAATEQAKIYSNKYRATLDLYRFDLLKSLHQSLPKTLDEEIKLWDELMRWTYTGDRGSVANMMHNHDKKLLSIEHHKK